MSKYVIAPAVADDLPACAEIINDYIDATTWLPRMMPREEIAALFTPEMLTKRTFLVAKNDNADGGEVGGYLSMNAQSGHIPGLYIKPAFQCSGAGRMLLNAAKNVRPAGLHLTVFEPNTHAKRFYEREGFVEALEERNDNTEEGVPTLMMRWSGN